jgi:hypothetical protein
VEEEGPSSEGPELLDFSVDDVAEQLTLMDVVGNPPPHRQRHGGRAAGGLNDEHTSHPHSPLPRSSSCA